MKQYLLAVAVGQTACTCISDAMIQIVVNAVVSIATVYLSKQVTRKNKQNGIQN